MRHVIDKVCWCGQQHVLISRTPYAREGSPDYRTWGDGDGDVREHVIEEISYRDNAIKCRCGESITGEPNLEMAWNIHRGVPDAHQQALRVDTPPDLDGNEASVTQAYLAMHYVMSEMGDIAFWARWPMQKGTK